MLIEVEGRVLASYPLELFDDEMLERIKRGEITVELERLGDDGTRLVTFFGRLGHMATAFS